MEVLASHKIPGHFAILPRPGHGRPFFEFNLRHKWKYHSFKMKGIKGWLEAPEKKKGLFIYVANIKNKAT